MLWIIIIIIALSILHAIDSKLMWSIILGAIGAVIGWIAGLVIAFFSPFPLRGEDLRFHFLVSRLNHQLVNL